MNWVSILILCILIVVFGVIIFFTCKGKHGGCCGDCTKCREAKKHTKDGNGNDNYSHCQKRQKEGKSPDFNKK